jgi:HAD superfamily 5'-nucleotidase-like hydrolase
MSVYVNRTLNLRKIRYLGFDMDHTLVRYHTEAFENTVHDAVLEKLKGRGYPEEVSKLPFVFDLAIRGLVIDKRKGNLLKVSRHGAIRGAMHGTTPMDFSTQRKTYSSTYIDLRDSRYSSIDTAFSLSSAGLFMQLVQLKDQKPQLSLPDYESMASDLLLCVDQAHRDGTLKSMVRNSLDRYIIKDPAVVEGLERFRKHDKKLFLVTNSDFFYTKLLLDYAINPFLKDHKSWQELFTFVVTSAQKPRFFFDDLKYLRIDPVTGMMSNLEQSLVPGIYQGGCASTFTKDLGLDGDDILYIGDHIYGDILRLKKDCNWRTAMVVEEIETEVEALRRVDGLQTEINKLMEEKEPLENENVLLVSQFVERKESPHSPRILELQSKMTEIDKKLGDLIRKHQSQFNPHWGEVMRAGNEESYFAHQTERFACIYMAKLSDLLSYSPRTYFRAPRIPLPHELPKDHWVGEID